MKLLLYTTLLVSILLATSCGMPDNTVSVTLAWDAPATYADGAPMTSGGVTGYRVYHGTRPGAMYPEAGYGGYEAVEDVGDVTQHTVTGLIRGNVYYFAVTAYNETGESGYSNEVWEGF